MSKMLKVLKEKYEGKWFSVIIGNRVNGGGGGRGLLKHSCIVCGRRCSPRASSPIGGAARSHARTAREKRREGTVHSQVLSRPASHAINGKLASRLEKVAIYWKHLEERTGEWLLRDYN